MFDFHICDGVLWYKDLALLLFMMMLIWLFVCMCCVVVMVLFVAGKIKEANSIGSSRSTQTSEVAKVKVCYRVSECREHHFPRYIILS